MLISIPSECLEIFTAEKYKFTRNNAINDNRNKRYQRWRFVIFFTIL